MFGFDVALDRSRASIVAAGVVGERVLVELVACRPGTEWLAPALAELRSPVGPGRDRGESRRARPGRYSRSSLEAGEPVEPYKAPGYTAACQTFYDLVIEGRLAHRGQAELDEAARVVGRRSVGESWVFGRAVSSARDLPARRRDGRGAPGEPAPYRAAA